MHGEFTGKICAKNVIDKLFSTAVGVGAGIGVGKAAGAFLGPVGAVIGGVVGGYQKYLIYLHQRHLKMPIII